VRMSVLRRSADGAYARRRTVAVLVAPPSHAAGKAATAGVPGPLTPRKRLV
jgi:hypothetical protein